MKFESPSGRTVFLAETGISYFATVTVRFTANVRKMDRHMHDCYRSIAHSSSESNSDTRRVGDASPEMQLMIKKKEVVLEL